MTFPSRNTPGCPHVGHSLMDSTGSASITVTITVFCGAADGIDDGISVGLHGRFLVLDGWFRHPYEGVRCFVCEALIQKEFH
ncbi:hypothetical protein CHUV2995_02711 [Corynebacterium diphtheriae subsp. lausannense]|nr:hypothetical protein CHUV2995_02711 [Corynebacterium diphtheriae subsp. lausannense]